MYCEVSKHLKDLKSRKIPVHFPNGNHSIVLPTPLHTHTSSLPTPHPHFSSPLVQPRLALNSLYSPFLLTKCRDYPPGSPGPVYAMPGVGRWGGGRQFKHARQAASSLPGERQPHPHAIITHSRGALSPQPQKILLSIRPPL